MKLSAPLTVFLSIAILLATSPAAAQTGPTQRQPVPIGAGARFLPSTTAVYVAADLLSPQWEHVNRLAAFYLGSQEIDEAQRRVGRPIGMSAREVIDEIQAWAGGELFVALPDIAELGRLQGLSGGEDPSLCDGPAVLVGAAIGDLSAFLAFVRRVDAQLGTAPAAPDAPGGAEIYEVGRSAAGPLFYVAIRDGFALASTSRQLLSEATTRNQADSLAALPAFGAAQSRLAGGSLSFLFAQYDAAQALSLGGAVAGAALGQRRAVSRIGAALRLAGDSVRVDISADTPPESLGPAARALLTKGPNPVLAASIVPTQSVVFVSWDNVKLGWDAVVEAMWPDRAQYDGLRRDFVQETGLDPDEDVFGWMTGELGLLVAPTNENDPVLRNVGLGAVLEAKDPAVAREKIDKMVGAVRRLGGPENQPTIQEIAGIPFHRVPLSGETALYVGLADRWVVLTTSAGLASDVVGGVRGAGGLDRSDEYRFVRNALGDPVQSVAYVDVPQLVALVTSVMGPAGEGDEAQAVLRPIRSVGFGYRTSAERTDASLFARVVVPNEPLARVRRAPSEPSRLPALVDASRHGGAWWGPDEEPTLFARPGAPEIPSRGRAFVRLLRDEVGVSIGRVVGPGGQVELEGTSRFAPNSLRGQRLVVRIGSDGAYSEEEIATYQEYVRCGGELLLLADGRAPGESDELAAAFGLQVAGTTNAAAVVDRYAAPLGEDLPPLVAPRGTGLLDWDEYIEPVAFLSDDSYLDLDGDGQRGADEPAGVPAAAVVRYGWGRVAFLGTTALLDSPEHPLTTALLAYLLRDAPWPAASNHVFRQP